MARDRSACHNRGMRQRLALPLLLSCLLVPSLAQASEPGERTIQLLTGRKYTDLETHLSHLHGKGREAGRWITSLEVELQGMLDRVSEPKDLIRYTNEWGRQAPRSAWPFLVRSELAMAQEWIDRRQGRSRERTDRKSWLDYARNDLDYAQGVRPRIALVLARRITIMTVTNDSRFSADRLRRQALSIDRGDVTAALAYAEYLLPQWNGEGPREAIDFAFEFCRDGRSKPAREYVHLWVHSQLADESYANNSARMREIRRLVGRLDSNFPNAWRTHVASAEIHAATENWKTYAAALETAAKLGHKESMRRVATYYASGKRGFHKDATVAIEWRERLARVGDGEAMVALGWQLARGEGVAKDVEKGLIWFERAARQDAAGGHAALGFVYGFGKFGKAVDPKRALRHLEEGRRLGDADASYHLGRLYNGKSLGPRDGERATRLLVEAGERGQVEAYLYLARCFESSSPKNAVHYYREAREAGGEVGVKATKGLLLLLRKRPEFRAEGDPEEVIDPTR